MSIPKIVHYCWFGPKEIPDHEQSYINGWKEKLPDYTFMLWNEQSFDMESVPYVRQAYECKKFAFVADYVRLYALIQYGGIYMDTDVELLKRFDEFENDSAFIGFENRTMVGTGIMGTIPQNPIFVEMIHYYDTHSFVDENGIMDTTTNVKILNKLLLEKGLAPENREQHLGDMHVYERKVFCPKKVSDTEFNVEDASVTIHHFDASWLSEREKKRGTNLFWRNVCRPILRKLRTLMQKMLGEKRTKAFEAKLRDKIR